jgi:hypothetical protein
VQDLIDTAKKILVQNRTLVRGMQIRAGLTVPSDSEDSVYMGFKEVQPDFYSFSTHLLVDDLGSFLGDS